MAIRINYGKAETIGRLGLEAGRGKARGQSAEDELRAGLQNAELTERRKVAAIQADTVLTKATIDAQTRRETMEFESFMKGESDKRAMAWEQEKIELRSQHDFDMQEQTRDLQNQYDMDKELKAQAKIDTQKSALDAAVERGDISPEEAAREKLRIEIGVSGSQSRLFGKVDPIAEAIRASMAGGQLDSPTASPTARAEASGRKAFPDTFDAAKTEQAVSEAGGELNSLASSKLVTSGQREAIRELLGKSGVTQAEISMATEALQAKIEAASSAEQGAAQRRIPRQTMGSFR